VGGNGGNTYLWDNAETTATATKLTAGIHTVTVTDSKGCTTSCDVTIGEPKVLSASATATAESCAGGDGSIALTVTGGTSGYTFNWTKVGDATYNSIVEDPSGLSAGTYNVTVTDANKCTTTASATVNGPVNCAHIFPTQTTCQDYVNKVPVLDAVCMTASNSLITNATPGVFFYYGDFIASATDKTTKIIVDQMIPSNTNMTKYFDPQNSSNVRVYDANCQVQKIRATIKAGGDVEIIFSATSEAKYVVSVKYDVKSIIGDNAPTIKTNYTFGMRDASANAISGTFGLIEVKNCSAQSAPLAAATTTAKVAPVDAKTTTTGFDAYPVPFKDQLTIKYKFDYKSDVKIEVFNAQGVSVLSKTDTNSYLDKEVTLDLKASKRQEQVYVVKVTTNQGTFTKKVMSTK
jgi:hypothetical protein